jgi:hypothetical protein
MFVPGKPSRPCQMFASEARVGQALGLANVRKEGWLLNFVYMFGWVAPPPRDVILAQLACPLRHHFLFTFKNNLSLSNIRPCPQILDLSKDTCLLNIKNIMLV